VTIVKTLVAGTHPRMLTDPRLHPAQCLRFRRVRVLTVGRVVDTDTVVGMVADVAVPTETDAAAGMIDKLGWVGNVKPTLLSQNQCLPCTLSNRKILGDFLPLGLGLSSR
jgi:hypothetical protein